MGLTIEALMGKPKDDDDPESPMGSDGDDFSDLSPAQVVEHLHASSEAAIKAVSEGSPVAFAKALEAMVKLFELKGDDAAPPSEEEEAPESGG
jgi:hypothetical protein